jgi:hypothetical protein
MPAVQLPDGVDGYQCYRRETFPGAVVHAEASPDYQGGYVTLTMGWKMPSTGSGAPEVLVVWESGRPWSGSFLNVSQAVRPLPPPDTQISFRLSSGETITQTLIPPNYWQEWRRIPASDGGYFGGFVLTREPAFMDAFTRATWADIDIATPEGTSLAHTRLDLSGLSAQLETMHRLADTVRAATADYGQACAPLHFEYN